MTIPAKYTLTEAHFKIVELEADLKQADKERGEWANRFHSMEVAYHEQRGLREEADMALLQAQVVISHLCAVIREHWSPEQADKLISGAFLKGRQ